MIGLAFALALAAPNLDAVDDSNAAMTSCLFAVMRAEQATGSSPDRFAAALASGCTAEQARYRGLAIPILVGRGLSRRAAAADIDAVLAKTRADLVAEYARFAALGLFKPAP